MEPSQAGQTVRCECGAELKAPSLRELRQLPQTEASPEQKAATRPRWSHEQGTLFVSGAVLALFCGFLVYFFQMGRSGLVVDPPTVNYEGIRADLATKTPPDLLDEWNEHVQHPLERTDPHYLTHRKYDRILRTFVWLSAAGLASGLAMMAVSMLKKRRGAGEAATSPPVGSSR